MSCCHYDEGYDDGFEAGKEDRGDIIAALEVLAHEYQIAGLWEKADAAREIAQEVGWRIETLTDRAQKTDAEVLTLYKQAVAA